MRRTLRRSISAGAVGSLLLVCSGAAAAQDAEFNLSCNPDEVLVGISGRQGWWMGGIAARCRSVAANGALGTTVRTTAYRGSSGATLRTFDCGTGEVMVGYRAFQGDNGYVLHVHEIVCAPWRADSRTAGTPTEAVSAFDEKPGAGRPVADLCSRGTVGTRLRGRAGQYLNRLMDMGCSYAPGAGALPGAAVGERQGAATRSVAT